MFERKLRNKYFLIVDNQIIYSEDLKIFKKIRILIVIFFRNKILEILNSNKEYNTDKNIQNSNSNNYKIYTNPSIEYFLINYKFL